MTAVNIGKQHPVTYPQLMALITQPDLAMKASGLDPLLAVVAARREPQCFTTIEWAALALAEQVTKLPNPESRGWDEDAPTGEQGSAVACLAAVVMNAWNRVAVTSRYPVGP